MRILNSWSEKDSKGCNISRFFQRDESSAREFIFRHTNLTLPRFSGFAPFYGQWKFLVILLSEKCAILFEITSVSMLKIFSQIS